MITGYTLISLKASVMGYLGYKRVADTFKVSRLSDKWRSATNSKRAQGRGGFGGIASLEKKRHFRAAEAKPDGHAEHSNGYGMVFNKSAVQSGRRASQEYRQRSRSRSPRRRDRYRERTPTDADQSRSNASRNHGRDHGDYSRR